jgi:YidC/Oxa1 family membrane protein insertase
MADQKNLLLAIVISVAIILASQFLLPGSKHQPPPGTGQQTAGETVPGAGTGGAGGRVPQVPGSTSAAGTTGSAVQPGTPRAGSSARAPGVPGTVGGAPAEEDRAAILKRVKRLRIETPRLRGSIALTGAKLDDLVLRKYRVDLPKTSPPVTLLNPFGSPNAYFVEQGWVAADKTVALPSDNTLWTADRAELKPGQPVTLSWDNGQGLKFERKYVIDKNYLITVTQRVINSGAKPVALYPYAVVSRWGTPKTSGWYVLHEGPYGVFRKQKSDSGSLDEIEYKDLRKKSCAPGTECITKQSVGGWLGFTDRYWMVAVVPHQETAITATFRYTKQGTLEKYQADDILRHPLTVAANGGTAQYSSYIFAGAKELAIIDAYLKKPGIIHFDLAIDFGWFYFLTKPIFLLLVMINHVVGNFGVAILLLTMIAKLLFFPLANKSYKAMGKMKALTPKMQQIKERFGDNKELQNRELMELYKREKVNPMAGCWPILIQIPVFFSLYKVLLVNIEMRHAPFFWWIQDLSARDPTTVLNLFGLIPYTPPTHGILAVISIGVWPLLMGCSMWAQQRLNPAPPDPVQARIFMMLPIVFTFMLAHFAAGLVIYWTWNNLLSMAQQWTIMKRHGRPSQATAPRAGGPPKKKKVAAAKSATNTAQAMPESAAAGADDEAIEPIDGDADGQDSTASANPGAGNRGRTPPRSRGRSKRRSR